MQLEELFRRLSFGELSNLSIGSEGSGSIPEESHGKVIQYANEALLRIYSRFLLKSKDLIIEQVRHITNYQLHKQFAESSGSDVKWPYIKDLPDEPFTEDVIKILAVFDGDGCKLPLNDRENKNSLFTPQPDVLQVPTPKAGIPLGVEYQARHPVLNTEDKYLSQELEVPFYLEGALQSFVAHKVFSHMGGGDNLVKSQEHEAAYEKICLEVLDKDLGNTTAHTSHSKLELRGFV